MPIYYHATPYENLGSILANGIRLSFGEVYCSGVAQTAACWVSFTRRQHEQIITIPFDTGDVQLPVGVDHSPIMTEKILGVDNATAAFVSHSPILPHQIILSDIRVWQNPWVIKGDDS